MKKTILMTVVISMLLGAGLAQADFEPDLIPDTWELSYYASPLTAAPLDDTDGDTFNTWEEWKAGTSPIDDASFPVNTVSSIRTSDGSGFDGTLIEINGDAEYDGGFVVTDTPHSRNHARQDGNVRHYLTVLKFDLSSVPATLVGDVVLNLTLHGSTSGSSTKTVALFSGNDALITSSIGYNAANPFIDDAYEPEVNGDTDFASGTVETLFTFSNSTGGGTVETLGSGNANLRNAVFDAFATDDILTLILYGGTSQYLTQGDEDSVPANRPTLVITPALNSFPDEDADTLPDAWEAQYLVSLAYGANDDPDGDGVSNYNEWLAGTRPDERAPFTKLMTTTTYDGSGALTTAGNWDTGMAAYDNPGLVSGTDSPASLGQGWWNGISVRQTGGELFYDGNFAMRGGVDGVAGSHSIIEIDDASNTGSYTNLAVSGRFTMWNQHGSDGATGSTLSLLNGYATVGEFWANSGSLAKVFIDHGTLNAGTLAENANAVVTMMDGGTGAFNIGDIQSTAYMNQMLFNFETGSEASFTIGEIAGATAVGYWQTKIAANKVQINGVVVTDVSKFQITSVSDFGTKISLPTLPDQAAFEGTLVALSSTAVGMTAIQDSALDGVVEYLFTEISGNPGGTDSAWQTGRAYADEGLTAGLQYSYTVTVRYGAGQIAPVSAVASVTLPATEPTAASAVQSGVWSNPATWGGSLPQAESDVEIPMGVTVTIVGDQECGSVMVMGKLMADPAADCSLHCDWVMVMGVNAAFEVGTNAARYAHQFTLTLKGLLSEANPGGMGSKFLGTMGGKIDIHGPDRESWTKLSATAVAGSTSITLDNAVDWVAGEAIVVTSTDTDWNHAEEMTIASVSGDGLTVTLTAPLAYQHTGETETHTRPTDNKSWSIELKAEVGLLSRSVTIQGDIYSESAGFGGHTMAMNGGTLNVEGAELYRMGQKSIQGRYPIHWHLLTDQAQGQYVRNSSIHHSFSRAVTIHGTDFITVEDNFCYDHIGHGIFLENGAERFNTIKGNVVLLTRRPAPGEELTPSDNSDDEFQNRTPASFWITNPNNTIEDNIAAGTQGTGYWFIFPTTPLEPAASLTYYAGAEPSKEPLGKFDRNTAHSCMNGLDINDQLDSDHSIRKNAAWDNDGPFYFNDCAWFSNNAALYAGIGGGKQNVVYYNHSLADNENSVVLATYHTVKESMLIADSGHGNLLGATPFMYWIYDGAGQMVDNHMIGWDAEHANLFFAPGAATKHPNHRFSGFTWDHAGPPRNVHTRFNYDELPAAGVLATKGYHNSSLPDVWGQVVYDLDGSVAGVPGSALIATKSFMLDGSETMPDNWSQNVISPNRFAHLRCTYSEFPPNVSVLRTKSGTKTEGVAYDGIYITVLHHQLPLIVNNGFLYTYSYESLPLSQEINVNFDDTEVGDSVLLRFKDFGQLSGLSVTGTAHTSLASLEAATSTGYYVEPSGDLYLQPVSTQRYNNLITITWSGSLSMPILDANLDGVDDMTELYDGTDPFGFAEAANDNAEFTAAAGFNGWSANAAINAFEVNGGALRGSIIANDAQLSKMDFNLNGNSALQIRVRYKHSSNGTVDFSWSTSAANSFSATRQLSATYSGAGDWQELVFDLGREPQWLDQVITGIQLDLNSNSGDFEIDYIRGAGPGQSDYSVWAAGWYGGYLSDPWSDWNGNGLSNHAERLWGMDPFVAGRSSAITQPLNVATGVFTYTRRDVGLSSAAYSIWVSTDLVGWTEDTAAVQTRQSLSDGVETMEVTLDSGLLNHDELFIQVRAVE